MNELGRTSASGDGAWTERALELPLPKGLKTFSETFGSYEREDVAFSLAVLLLAFVGGRLLAALCIWALARWAKHTESTLDDALARNLKQPLGWLFPALVLRSLIPLLTLPPAFAGVLAHFLAIVIISCIGWLCLRGTRVAEQVILSRFDLAATENLRARAIHTQVRAFKNVASFVIIVLTVGALLTTFSGVRAVGAGLLASTGVAGVVLGFAAQRSIALVLAGIHIAISQPIRADDVVIVEGEWGRVEEITLTYVVIRIWDLRRLIVPITYFIEKPFQNWTRVSAELLGTAELHLDYSVPMDALKLELKRIVEASEHWDGKVAIVQVTGASERTMLVRPLVSAANSGALWNLRCEVREKLIEFVQKNYPGALPRLRADFVPPGVTKPVPVPA